MTYTQSLKTLLNLLRQVAARQKDIDAALTEVVTQVTRRSGPAREQVAVGILETPAPAAELRVLAAAQQLLRDHGVFLTYRPGHGVVHVYSHVGETP